MRKISSKLTAILLAAIMMLSLIPVFSVTAETESYSDTFKRFINDDGKFVINRYDPAEDGDDFAFCEEVCDLLSMDLDSGSFSFTLTDVENQAIVSLYNDMGEKIEEHTVDYVFNYDPEVYKDAQAVLNALPKGEDSEESMYCYKIADLELLDYLFDYKLGEENIAKAVNYSGTFKSVLGNKPYSIYVFPRMGGNDANVYIRETGGSGTIMHNGVAYGSKNMKAITEYKMYVPGDTANTSEAKISTLQTRLDKIYGKGKVTVKEITLLEAYLWQMFGIDYDMISEAYPNPNFQSYKNGEYLGLYPALPDPESPDYEKDVSQLLEDALGIENATFETKSFLIEVNGICHPILIENNKDITIPTDPEKEPEKVPEKETEKEPENTKSEVVLVKEDIVAKLEYADDVFPANTVVKVEQQKQGAIVERAQKALSKVAKKIAVFEITAKSDNVTVQPNGKVKVIFEIPENFDPAKTVLYYVGEDGKFERIPLTISGDKKTATAELTHFSTYVLSETVDSPKTGDNGNIMIWLLALGFISAVSVIYGTKKIKQ